MYILLKSKNIRGIAQSGSASGLGPEGRKFKSCCPDQFPTRFSACSLTFGRI